MTQLSTKELSHIEKKQMLQDSDWANDLSSMQIDTLVNYFKSYSMQPDSRVMDEGKTNDKFCLLCEGNVDVVKENSSGQQKILQSLNPGKIFGELSFFDGSPCSASIIAKSDIKILVLHKEDFTALSNESPNIALTIILNLFKKLSQRLRHTTGQLIDLL